MGGAVEYMSVTLAVICCKVLNHIFTTEIIKGRDPDFPFLWEWTQQYFVLATDYKHFLFKEIHFHGAAGTAVVCIIIFVFTILLEATKAFMFYIQLRLTQNPLTYGRTNTSINQDRSSFFSSLMIPSSIQHVKRQRLKFNISAVITHTFNLILGYIIMLCVMSYDVYILIAVLVGSGSGYFLFGAINNWNRSKYASLHRNIYERYDSRTVLTDSEVHSST